MGSTDLDPLFDPDGVALVGASADPNKIAGRPYEYLRKHGYAGEVSLVNPTHDSIRGKPCYDHATDVPGSVDLALVLVPAGATSAVVRECGEAGIPFAIVVASGFGETGADGEARREDLLAAAEAGDVRIVGPNCEGMVNIPTGAAVSFSSILKRETLRPGGLAFITQSGAFGGALFQLTQDLGLGASKWISTGNEADLSTIDILAYLVEDPATDVVVSYIESLQGGDRLLAVGRRAMATDTEIVVMRVGGSERGEAVMASHTGSIATDDAVYEALFRQAGVTRVRSVDAFADTVGAVSRVPAQAYPATESGRGIAVVSISGGAAALIADTADRVGLELAALDAGTVAAIDEVIPDYGSPTNPVDVTGAAIEDPAVFAGCLADIVDDDAVTGLLLQFGNSGPETIAASKADLLSLQQTADLPVATVFTGGVPARSVRDELRDHGVLYFEDPVRAVTTFRHLADRSKFRSRVTRLPTRQDRDRTALPDDWDGVTGILAEHGVTFAPGRVVASPDAAVSVADQVGYPVVLKFSPLEVAHKTEVGGLRTGLESPDAVRDAYAELVAADPDAGVLVQPMVDGTEVLVGVVDDPDFGPVLTLGPGGTFVELFDDFAHRGLPVTPDMAREMIAETVTEQLLAGFRDRPPAAVDALATLAANLTTAYEATDVTELECNPVVVTEDDALIVDLLVR